MAYVDFMVTPVPKDKLAEYKKLCRKSAAVWKKCGALAYAENIEDDVKPGKLTSFPQSVKLKKNEVVVVAYIFYKSKAHRNATWKKIMKDPFMANFDWKSAPFDGKRMIYGGFKPLVSV
jgi:uncharacterized protein YbaA (DUF1428 family)